MLGTFLLFNSSNSSTRFQRKIKEVIEKVEKVEKVKGVEVEKTETFGEAFLKAWRAGEKNFTWNGTLYTTERADGRVVSGVGE